MFRLLAAFAAFSLIAAGCATQTMALAPERLASLSGKTYVGVEQKPLGFFHMTPASAAFAGLGALVMEASAEGFRIEHGIVDPAPDVEKRLIEKLANAYRSTPGETLDNKAANDNAPLPVRPGVIYVDAKTTSWQYVYFSLDWGHYQVRYSLLTRLVDGETGTVLGQHECIRSSPEDSKGAPTEEELLANKSQLLNKLLAQVADDCATEFEMKVLGSKG